MSLILCIETASEICSVAVVNETSIFALCENHEGNAHASRLTLLIEEAVQKAGITLQQLDAIAVSKGPGSYTGLRVGVSTAKGLCYALGKPLLAVNTLESMAQQVLKHAAGEHTGALLVPMLDARRMEVYCLITDAAGTVISPAEAKIIDTYSFETELNKGTVCFFGNGADKCKDTITHPNAVFIPAVKCSAAGMHSIATELFMQQQFENTAYFEPFYLKDFVGTTPKKQV